MRHAHDAQRQLLQMLQLRRHLRLQLRANVKNKKGRVLDPPFFIAVILNAVTDLTLGRKRIRTHRRRGHQTAIVTPALYPPPAASTESPYLQSPKPRSPARPTKISHAFRSRAADPPIRYSLPPAQVFPGWRVSVAPHSRAHRDRTAPRQLALARKSANSFYPDAARKPHAAVSCRASPTHQPAAHRFHSPR